MKFEWFLSDEGVEKTGTFIEKLCNVLLGAAAIGLTALFVIQIVLCIANG